MISALLQQRYRFVNELTVIQQRVLTSDQHDTDCENLLCISVWGYIAKSHRCQTAECEVEGSDIP